MDPEVARLHRYLKQLGFPDGPHPESPALLAQLAEALGRPLQPVACAFLERILEVTEIWSHEERAGSARGIVTFDPELVLDWSFSALEDELRGMVCFASDGGSNVFAFDPDNRFGLGQGAVYTISMGARAVDYVDLIALSLVDLLAIHADAGVCIDRRLLDLRDEQTATRELPLALGDGRAVPGDLVFEPRYHPGLDVLRSVRLRGPLLWDGVPFGPAPKSAIQTTPDLAFRRTGQVIRGYLPHATSVRGLPLAAGFVAFHGSGELECFTLESTCLVRGVPCQGGTEVLSNGDTFHFVPAQDVLHRNFPCRAGKRVADYGPGLGMSFTASRDFLFGVGVVPAGVEVGETFDGELRFKLLEPRELEGRVVPPATEVWYELSGKIKSLYPKPDA